MWELLAGFALSIAQGAILAVITAASIRCVGWAVKWLLEPNDWFCKAIQNVSHISSLIMFFAYEIRELIRHLIQ